MEARYTQAAELQAKIIKASISGRVEPRWIPDTSWFWYRKHFASHPPAFFLVNAETGETRPMFNHDALSKTLVERSVQESAQELPFNELDIAKDLTTIRFCVDDKLWQYNCMSNELLEPDFDGQHVDTTDSLERMEEECESELDLPKLKCCLTFINQRSSPVRIWWIDYQGKPQLPKVAQPGKSCLRFTWSGHVWRVCDDTTGKVIASYAVPRLASALVVIKDNEATLSETSSVPSAAPSLQAIVKHFDVYVRGKDSPDVQLSPSGSQYTYFDADHIYPTEDGRYACVWQIFGGQSGQLFRIQSSPRAKLTPLMISTTYFRPGDKKLTERPRLFDLVQRQEIPVSDAFFGNPYDLENIGWNFNNQKYRFIYNERGHKVLRVIEFDVTGHTRILVEERQDTFVDYNAKIHWHLDEDTDEFLWTSERNGSNHLYLFYLSRSASPDGQPDSVQLTHGPGNVRRIEHVDTKARYIYVAMVGAVAGQDPYYEHLARVGMDDSSFTVLTKGDGNHRWSWSPDFRYFVDEWSRVDQPFQVVLRDASGQAILSFDETDISNLTSTGWTPPERFTAPGRDGRTPIYGIIIKPVDFSPGRRYPIIEHIYAGPHSFHVPKSFKKLPELSALAALGFIVVQVDGMGTNWRTRIFHEKCYKNLKDAGLPDHIAWMRAAAKTRPWMDLGRVGIYGQSAGGQNALSAMLWHGDFYKAAAADSGCHDNRVDKLWWNELWMGWPVDKAYEDNSNVVNAHRLTGALMLTVGEMDDNVDPSCTLKVVHALNEAGKDYEFLFIPGGDHGAGSSSPYFVRRKWDFFVRHLIGAATPHWNSDEAHKKFSASYEGNQ